MLTVAEQIANLSDQFTSNSLYAQLNAPIIPISLGDFYSPLSSANFPKIVINPNLWKTFNNVSFFIEYDSSEVQLKTVELDGSGSLSASTSITEINGIGRASVQLTSNGGKGIVLAFKPLDGDTYSEIVVKNYSLNGVASGISLPAIKGKFLSFAEPEPVVVDKFSLLDVIVDAGVLGENALLLKGLSEKITYKDGVAINHTVTYGDTEFNYSEIDSLISTVVRDGNFTTEFSQEISDYAPSTDGISYQNAIQLVGVGNIDAVILAVAGADGLFVY